MLQASASVAVRFCCLSTCQGWSWHLHDWQRTTGTCSGRVDGITTVPPVRRSSCDVEFTYDVSALRRAIPHQLGNADKGAEPQNSNLVERSLGASARLSIRMFIDYFSEVMKLVHRQRNHAKRARSPNYGHNLSRQLQSSAPNLVTRILDINAMIVLCCFLPMPGSAALFWWI